MADRAQSGRVIDEDLLRITGGLFSIRKYDHAKEEATLHRQSLEARSKARRRTVLSIVGAAAGFLVMAGALSFAILSLPWKAFRATRHRPEVAVMAAPIPAATTAAATTAAATTAAATTAAATTNGSAHVHVHMGASEKRAARRRRASDIAKVAAPAPEPTFDIPEPKLPQTKVARDIDPRALSAALEAAAGRASICLDSMEPRRSMLVNVTFLPTTGRATAATVEGGPFQGTEVGGCIARALRSAVVAPFEGTPVTVSSYLRVP